MKVDSDCNVLNWRAHFLRALRENEGAITYACKAAGIDYRTMRRLRDSDKEFDEAIRDVLLEVQDEVYKEFYRRSVKGVTRLKAIGSGANAQIIREKEYSDMLLARLMGGLDPRFRNNFNVEASGIEGITLHVKPPPDAFAGSNTSQEIDVHEPPQPKKPMPQKVHNG